MNMEASTRVVQVPDALRYQPKTQPAKEAIRGHRLHTSQYASGVYQCLHMLSYYSSSCGVPSVLPKMSINPASVLAADLIHMQMQR